MNANRGVLLTCLFTLVVEFVSGQSKVPVTGSKPAKQLNAVVQREGEAFINQPNQVGLSIGIVKNGQSSYYNFGTTEKGQAKLPTPNTIYEIGSVSKTFASLLLAQAVVEKRVSLNDDIRKYLVGEYPNLTYAGQPIRLVHLANTTSALPDNLPDRTSVFQQAPPDSIPVRIDRAMRSYTTQNFYHDLHTVKPDTVPGVFARHSNVGAQLLADILASIYQLPYEKLVEQRIEKPLRMNHTVVAETPTALLAVGHDEKGTRMPSHSLGKLEPSGGLRYSAADMVKYLAHQLNETNKAVALSHQPTWGNLNEQAISLNWTADQTVDSKRRFHHTGGTFGFGSYCAFYPELGFGIVVLANESDRATQGRLQQLAEQIVTGIYGTPPALTAFQAALLAHDYNQAITVLATVRKKHPELHLSEQFVNGWGYALARQGQTKQAIELFKLNVSLHPDSWNAYDSLAEAYEMSSNSALAITNYKQSLALNPRNAGAVEHLKKLDATAGK
jgi:D-alanyl-D-alanine-carboxypeptidase/D-alanyl-D-alanine-endopeptidase